MVMKMAMSGFTFTFLPTSSTVIGFALGPAGYNRIHVYVAYKYDSVYSTKHVAKFSKGTEQVNQLETTQLENST